MEHAAAGGALDSRYVNADFLPWVDAQRLFPVCHSIGEPDPTQRTLLRAWREIANATHWHDPERNREALALWGPALGLESGELPRVPFQVRLSTHRVTPSEILARVGHRAICTWTLGDTPIAITGGEDRTVRVWGLDTGLQIGEPMTGHSAEVTAIAAAQLQCGTPVAIIGSLEAINVWDLTTRQQICEPMVGHAEPVTAVAAAHLIDGRAVAITGSDDQTIRVWDLATGEEVGEPLVGQVDQVTGVAAAQLKDGTPIAVAVDFQGTVEIWNLETRQPMGEPLTGHESTISGVTTSQLPDGTPIALTCSDDGTLQVWDLATRSRRGEPMFSPTGLQGVAAATLTDGTPTAVTSSLDNTIRVWDLTVSQSLREPSYRYTSWLSPAPVSNLPDGTPIAITSSDDGVSRVWDLATAQEITQLNTGQETVTDFATANLPNGVEIAITRSEDNVARVWDLATGEQIGGSLTDADSPVTSVASAELPGGTPIAITGSFDQTVRVWDLTTGEQHGEPLRGHGGWVRAVAATTLRDGTPIAVTGGHDLTVRVWDLATGRQIGEPLTGHTNWVHQAATTRWPTGTPIAVTADYDGVIRVWDLDTHRQLVEITTGQVPVSALAATQLTDGTPIAITGREDGTVEVWDLHSATLLLVLPMIDQVLGLAVGPGDGSGPLLAVSANGLTCVTLKEPATPALRPAVLGQGQEHEARDAGALRLPGDQSRRFSEPWDAASTVDSGRPFIGRQHLMNRLLEFSAGQGQGVLLVTGCSGSGKTAALRRLVALSNPKFQAEHAAHLDGLALNPVLLEDSNTVWVDATDKNAVEVLTQICQGVGACLTDELVDPLTLAQSAWETWSDDAGQRVTIIVDELDRASSPIDVIAGALIPLVEQGDSDLVRLLVGVTCPSDQTSILGNQLVAQLENMLDAHAVEHVQVDQAPYWDATDVRRYVATTLQETPGSPYRHHTATAEVAAAVGEGVGTSFLTAKLAADQLAAGKAVVDLTDPTWRRAIEQGALGVFREALHQMLPQRAQRERAIHLLRALAFAYGRGLPSDEIWPAVATAVADVDALPYGIADVEWLLSTKLRGYVVEDFADGVPVYRLAHSELRAALRGQWRELLD